MKIQGKMSADVVGITIKRNKSHDGKEAHLDLEVGIDAETCAETWGDDLRTLAFSGMRIESDEDGEDGYRHLMDTIKPGSRVVYEHHEVKIHGAGKIRCQPQLLRISTIDGKPSGVVRLRLDIEAARAAELTDKVGATIKVEFNPSQGELGFTAAKGNGATDPSPKRRRKLTEQPEATA